MASGIEGEYCLKEDGSGGDGAEDDAGDYEGGARARDERDQ